MEKLKIDRGLQFNKCRLRNDLVDIVFKVEQQTFPAHRLIVALQSPYLKKLTDESSPFIER